MTVSTTQYFTDWVATNGANKNWGYNFTIQQASDVRVHVRDDATLAVTVYDSGFTFVPIDESSGTVVYPSSGPALAAGKSVRVVRTLIYTQTTEIGNEGAFNPELHENTFDRMTMMIQQLGGDASRAVLAPLGSPGIVLRDGIVDNSTLVKVGNEIIQGPSATNVANAQAYANAAQASAEDAQDSEDAAAASAALVANAIGYLSTSEYNFATATGYPPASGQTRLDAAQGVATKVYLSHLNLRGVDLTKLIPLVVSAGSQILLQSRADPSKYVIYNVIADPVLSGSDYQLSVVLKENGAALTAEPITVGFSGGGGSSVITTDDNPPAAPLRDGQLWFKSSTGRLYTYYDDSNSQQWVQVSAAPQTVASASRNRGHIDPGFNLSNDATDATNDILFPSGVVASDVAPYPLMQHAATIRQLDVNFDVNNTDRLGGRFSSAAISDGTWHCFVISNGTLVKSGFSKNLNPTADDLYPAGYTHYRRVASWLRESGVLVPLVQDGDDFLRKVPFLSVNVANLGAAAVLYPLAVPTGIKVMADLSGTSSNASNGSGSYMYISSPDQSDVAASFTAITNMNSAVNIANTYTKRVLTDTAGQIRARALTASTSLTVSVNGWTDKRGRQ